MARRARKAASPPKAEPEQLPEELPDEEGGEEEERHEDEEESGSGGEDDDDGSSEEEIEVEANVTTRARRSNAGGRMMALIEDEAAAGIEADEMFREEENDEEFAQKEEKDEFDSDFGSTDEGEGDEEDDEEAGERKLQREAKEAKKAARGKKGFQAPVHPFARQTKASRKAASRQPVASTSADTLDGDRDDSEPPKKKKKVAVDSAFLAPQRESSRRTAVEIRKQVQDRAKESEQRKATAPKQQRKATVKLTQADLIAEALETEETNRAALLAFYAAEEGRREAERIAGMRYEIIGPKLTFLSRVQDRVDKGKGKEGEGLERGRKRMIEVLGETGQKGWKGTVAADETPAPPSKATAHSETASVNGGPRTKPGVLEPLDPNGSPSVPPEKEEYARNWLVFDNFEGGRAEELEAVFGDHVDWSQPAPLPVRVTKKNVCPITGLPARYRDPRTLTPYATLAAYHAIRAVVDAQAFVWSESLGAYTAAANFGIMRDVEASWARRPQLPGMVPRYAGAQPASTPKAGTFGNIANPISTPVPKPRQKRSVPAENPYKISYQHAGGSGRGQRGRSSTGDVAADGPPPPPPAAMHPVAMAASSAPNTSAPPGLQPIVAPQPYNVDDVYRQGSSGTPVAPSPQAYSAPSPHAGSPSLVGTSTAPMARTIRSASGRAVSDAFGPVSPAGPSPAPQEPAFPPDAMPLPGTLPPLPPS